MPSPAFCRIRGSPDRRRNGVPLRVSHGLPGSVSSPNDCRYDVAAALRCAFVCTTAFVCGHVSLKRRIASVSANRKKRKKTAGKL